MDIKRGARRVARRMQSTIWGSAAIAILLTSGGCPKEKAVILDFTIPDRYTGYFWIIVDRENGIELKKDSNRVAIRIPPTGVLRVRDDALLIGLRKYTAVDYSGQRVVTVTSDDSSPEKRALRSLGVSSDGVHTFMVGTLQDAAAFDRDSGVDARRQLQERLRREEEPKGSGVK